MDVGEGHRRRAVDHGLPQGDGRRVRHRQAHPLRPQGASPRTGPTPTTVWTVRVDRGGEEVELTASFLFACSGYYNYDQGYTPEFAGSEDFAGTIIHPQHWPEDLDYAGKKIVVIGSGATAVTLIPALANSGAGHVTMLQRSPTYIGALPDVDPFTVRMNKTLPEKPAYVVNRWKSILFQSAQYRIARRFPKFMRKTLMTMARASAARGLRRARSTSARSYNPWDERLCLAPNGDLFKTIKAGKADVVTDTIERFTKTGIKLASGEELEADIIVTATGLNLQLFGGAEIMRNGVPVELNDTMAYKGMMLTHMPNMAFTIGYTNASWTLKADLVSEFVCRVLNYMDAKGFDTVEPQHPGNCGRRGSADGLHPWLCAARVGLPAEVRARRAVAAQAELPARPAV